MDSELEEEQGATKGEQMDGELEEEHTAGTVVCVLCVTNHKFPQISHNTLSLGETVYFTTL